MHQKAFESKRRIRFPCGKCFHFASRSQSLGQSPFDLPLGCLSRTDRETKYSKDAGIQRVERCGVGLLKRDCGYALDLSTNLFSFSPTVSRLLLFKQIRTYFSLPSNLTLMRSAYNGSAPRCAGRQLPMEQKSETREARSDDLVFTFICDSIEEHEG